MLTYDHYIGIIQQITRKSISSSFWRLQACLPNKFPNSLLVWLLMLNLWKAIWWAWDIIKRGITTPNRMGRGEFMSGEGQAMVYLFTQKSLRKEKNKTFYISTSGVPPTPGSQAISRIFVVKTNQESTNLQVPYLRVEKGIWVQNMRKSIVPFYYYLVRFIY